MKTIDQLLAEGVAGQRVFVRADLNVPLDGTTITDDGRIRAVQPTVAKLAEAGARVVVASTSAAPRAPRTRPSRWPPRPPGSVNCSAPTSPSRPTPSASRPAPSSPAWRTARSR